MTRTPDGSNGSRGVATARRRGCDDCAQSRCEGACTALSAVRAAWIRTRLAVEDHRRGRECGPGGLARSGGRELATATARARAYRRSAHRRPRSCRRSRRCRRAMRHADAPVEQRRRIAEPVAIHRALPSAAFCRHWSSTPREQQHAAEHAGALVDRGLQGEVGLEGRRAPRAPRPRCWRAPRVRAASPDPRASTAAGTRRARCRPSGIVARPAARWPARRPPGTAGLNPPGPSRHRPPWRARLRLATRPRPAARPAPRAARRGRRRAACSVANSSRSTPRDLGILGRRVRTLSPRCDARVRGPRASPAGTTHLRATAGLADEGHAPRVAAERGDVLLHPAQRQLQVEHADAVFESRAPRRRPRDRGSRNTPSRWLTLTTTVPRAVRARAFAGRQFVRGPGGEAATVGSRRSLAAGTRRRAAASRRSATGSFAGVAVVPVHVERGLPLTSHAPAADRPGQARVARTPSQGATGWWRCETRGADRRCADRECRGRCRCRRRSKPRIAPPRASRRSLPAAWSVHRRARQHVHR